MVDQVFQLFLLAAAMLRRQLMLSGILGNVAEGHLPVKDLLPKLTVPAGVASGHAFIQLTVLNHPRRNFQRQRHGIHRANMTIEQVVFVGTLPAHFRIKVEAAGGEAARFEDFIHHQRVLFDAVRELVGIPAQLRIAAVGVDGTEQPQRDGRRDLMMERVAGEGRMVGFNVQFNLFFQTKLFEEAVNGRGIMSY